MRCLGTGDFSGFGLKRIRFQSAGPSHIGHQFVDIAVEHDLCGAGRFDRETVPGELFRGQAGRSRQFCAGAGRTRDDNFDPVSRPNISARMQTKALLDVLVIDVGQKIFVRGNAERGRPAAPLDLKSAVGFDFGELSDRPCVGDNVAVAHDSAQTATAA